LSQIKHILAIDPGSDKVGYAILDYKLNVYEKGIVYLAELHRTFKKFCSCDSEIHPEAVVIGNGTAAAVVSRLYSSLELSVPVRFAEEKNTTYKARARYFVDNPPKGIWKIVPLGLQLPPCPIDDYAAVLIGEKYLQEHGLATKSPD
jgi:RNase H-fold protein (predicted Holliday junction resolvase)